MDIDNVKFIEYETVDSTNTQARRMLQSGTLEPPAVITARAQTAGRGRQGRSFYSPAGTGIYMSIVTSVPENAEDIQFITLRASLAVSDAVYDVTGVRTGIKWVNDLYVGNKKVCGILTENVRYAGGSAAVIGIGINITTRYFPPEIAERAGSLGLPGEPSPELYEDILRTVASYVLYAERLYPDPKKFMDTYRERSIVTGRRVTYVKNGVPCEGTAVRIDDDGSLIVELSDGYDRLMSGDVSLKIR